MSDVVVRRRRAAGADVVRPPIPRGRRGLLAAGGCVLAVAAVTAVVVGGGASGTGAPAAATVEDGLVGVAHTTVLVSSGACGQGWTRPHGGLQVFDVRNDSDVETEVDLLDPTTGKLYGEVEALAPGTTRPLEVTLGNGHYAFRCLPDDSDALTGPTVTVTGATTAPGPAALPVTVHDLIPPTLQYQQWIGGQMNDLAAKVAALKSAIDAGDLTAARRAWLAAHLVYESMGAAYGTFGAADKEINGTTAGLPGGVNDPGFTGFHRIEYGLWHGQWAAQLRGPANRLATDVDQLRSSWAQARMDPSDMGLRAHEILENTMRFELTGHTDYGSGSNLATALANLQGTLVVLGYLRPVLTPRVAHLPRIDTQLDRLQRTLRSFDTPSGWTPVNGLALAQRERVDSDLSEAVEQLAPIAAVCDVRRTS